MARLNASGGAYMEQGTEVGFQKLAFAAKLQAGAQPVPPEQPALPLPIPAAGWSVLSHCIDPKKRREGQHSTLGIAAKPQEAAASPARAEQTQRKGAVRSNAPDSLTAVGERPRSTASV